MKIVAFLIVVLLILPITVSAIELEPPEVPDMGEKYIPPDTESFSEGVLYILKEAIKDLAPSIHEAAGICLSLLCVALIVSVLSNISNLSTKVIMVSAVVAIGAILLTPSGSLISLASKTIEELSQYGKLLMGVMTAALAAQGATTSSAAMYSGSMLFCNILTSIISKLVVPMIYIYLVLSVADAVMEESAIKELKKFVNWLISWSMKIVLYVFSGYIGITKIVTGSVDASTLRATKLTISGMVPVVGKIISDSSETILISAGIVKNSVGIYGMLAILSVIIGPFLKIGIQYLLLKITTSICGLFGVKKVEGIIKDFSKAMAMLVGMIVTMGLLLLISTVCFMKGVT